MNSGSAGSRDRRSRFLFLLCLAFLAAAYVPVLGGRRAPAGDTFQSANVAHFFLNGWIQNGSVPLWFPHLCYGATTQWYVAIGMSPALWLLLPVAKLFPAVHLLQLCYAGFFLEEVVLLVGTWLLARRLFAHAATAAFVTLSMTGATIWYHQIWFNFRLYYDLPLALYFIWRGIRASSGRDLCIGFAVVAIGCFGGLFYFPVVRGLTVAVFAAAAAWIYRPGFRRMASGIASGGWGLLLTAALAIWAYWILLSYQTDFTHYSGRGEDGSVPVDVFLDYGGHANPGKLLEFFTGVSCAPDQTLYAGVLALVFAALGVFRAPFRPQAPFLATGGLVLLFSLGTNSAVAPLAYHIPGLSVFRHIGLVTPIAKMFLILLSGFGFEFLARVVDRRAARVQDRGLRSLCVSGICLTAGVLALNLFAGVLYLIEIHRPFLQFRLFSTWYGEYIVDQYQFFARASFTALVCLAAILAFALARIRGARMGPMLLPVLLLVAAVDVLSFRVHLLFERTLPAGASWDLFRPRGVLYQPSRVKNYFDFPGFSRMAPALSCRVTPDLCEKSLASGRQLEYGKYGNPCIGRSGMVYNTLDVFLGLDPYLSLFKVDWWLRPVDRLLRAVLDHRLAGRPPIRDLPFGAEPSGTDAVFGSAGRPKLQAFGILRVGDSDEDLGRIWRRPGFQGGLFATRADFDRYRRSGGDSSESPAVRNLASWDGSGGPLPVPIEIAGFAADRLSVRLGGPPRDPFWLYYADTWHRSWKAYVDGKEVPILQANLAFKAVAVPPAAKQVEFVFSQPVIRRATLAAWAISTAGMLWVLWTVWRLGRST